MNEKSKVIFPKTVKFLAEEWIESHKSGSLTVKDIR